MNLAIKEDINNKIYSIRGKQVILDRDLAKLYGVETKRLNEQVKRNKNRFPERYMFHLITKEKDELVAKCDHLKNLKYSYSNPYAFTEQGIAMLSSILNSDNAIIISIKIIGAFVAMRHFLIENKCFFQKFQQIDQKLIGYDDNFNKIFKAIENKQLTPNQGIFFDGQIYDAFRFVVDLIKSAKKEIIIIDNFIDENVLTLLSNKSKDVSVIIVNDINNL
ncbi:MAG: ORF6N domain-containing protein [Candidatus Woesearchaeota archaeon]